MDTLLRLYELAGKILNLTINYLLMSPKSFMSGQMYGYAIRVFNVMTGIGAGLLSLFFVYGVLRSYNSFADLRRPGALIELLTRLVLSYGVVLYSRNILIAIMDVTQSLGRLVYNNSPYDSIMMVSDLPQEIVTAVGGLNIITYFGACLIVVLASFVVVTSAATILLTVFGRFFRVYMHIAVAPLPLSTLSATQTEQIGFSFLKSYLGCCLEVALIMLAIVLYAVFFHNNINTLELIDASRKNAVVFNWVISNTLHVLVLASIVRTCDNIIGRWLRI